MRRTWMLARLWLHLLVGGGWSSLVIPFAALGGQGVLSRYIFARAAAWARRAVRIAGGRVVLEGVEKIPAEGPVLYVVNHQSAMDIPVLLGHLPGAPGFVAKKELLNLPMLSFWMRRLGCVPIDRSNPRAGLKAVTEAAGRVRGGRRIVLFPEGTRTREPDGTMLPFKRGAFKLALESDAVVVPVTVEGSRFLLARGWPEGYHGQVKLIVHDPIPVAGMDDAARKLLSDRVETLISGGLKSHYMGSLPKELAAP
ncbi:MAG: 1-acyl-sn-glycerol-3-phosphate acyltransferase [Nitrospirota bacterium]|nr:1-acyl-sn-glycerol-3-phosphate acyltransferase [Nitrospirota bacterium]